MTYKNRADYPQYTQPKENSMSKKKDIEKAEAKLAAEINVKIAAEQEKAAQDAPGDTTGPEAPGDTAPVEETQPVKELNESPAPEIEILPVVRGNYQKSVCGEKNIEVVVRLSNTLANRQAVAEFPMGAIVDVKQVHIPRWDEEPENPAQMTFDELPVLEPGAQSCANCGWFNDDVQECVEPIPKTDNDFYCSEGDHWIPGDPDKD